MKYSDVRQVLNINVNRFARCVAEKEIGFESISAALAGLDKVLRVIDFFYSSVSLVCVKSEGCFIALFD